MARAEMESASPVRQSLPAETMTLPAGLSVSSGAEASRRQQLDFDADDGGALSCYVERHERPAMRTWRVLEDPTPEALAVISEGVLQHGRSLAVGGNARPLACLVADGGVVIAGASGRTEFSRLFVSYLWVAPALRGQGLGTLVLERFETAAQELGCSDALIETLNDRVALLYQRLGYASVSAINYVGPFRRHTLVKQIAPASVAR